jgi:hypothetical protein
MRKLIIPGIILVIFAGIWFIQSILESRQTSEKIINNFLDLKASEINRIEVKTFSGLLVFRLADGKWMLDGIKPRPVDSMAVNNMISSAVDIKVGNVISENIEKQSDFKVDSISGSTVRFYNNDKLLNSIIIGKMAPDYSHTFIRKPDSKEVYLADGSLTYVFNRQRTQWLNKVIFALSPDSIKEVEFVYPDKDFHIIRSAEKWFIAEKPFTDSLQTDSAKTAIFINLLSRLRANDFTNATDSGQIDFSQLSLTLQVTLANGSVHEISLASPKPNANRFFLRTPGDEETYVIYKNTYDNLAKDFSGFLP